MNKELMAKMRASFDFELMPYHALGEDWAEFVKQIALSEGAFLAEIMNVYFISGLKELGLEAGEEPLFTEEEFSVHQFCLDETAYIIVATLPELDSDEVICSSYIFFGDLAKGYRRFFTLEKENGGYCLGEVTPERHVVFGELPNDTETVAQTVFNIINRDLRGE